MAKQTETLKHEPNKLEVDYYPHLKINRRWYAVVPERADNDNPHFGCAFFDAKGYATVEGLREHCRLNRGYEHKQSPVFSRLGCGDQDSIFIAPSKFDDYRAYLVARQLNGEDE